MKSSKDDNFHKPFPRRLRQLLDGVLLPEKKTTQEGLAKEVGVTRQAIAQYKDGKTQPTIDVLERMADYYEVTTDFLLGRTDVSSMDTDLQKVSKFTGLSEKALENIGMLSISPNIEISKYERTIPCSLREVLDMFLSNENFVMFWFNWVKMLSNSLMIRKDGDSLTVLNHSGDYQDYNIWLLERAFSKVAIDVLDEVVNSVSQKAENGLLRIEKVENGED